MMDPTRLTALQSLDFGSVYTADGREHSVTAHTLPFLAELAKVTQARSSYPTDPPSTYPATGVNVPTQGSATTQAPTSNAGFSWPSWLTPSMAQDHHWGARAVVTIVALIILTVVLVRLLK